MKPYLVIGRGRLSRHLQHYLRLESIDFEQWDRSSAAPVEDALGGARAALLLISDDAIEPFLEEHARRRSMLWIHCCGSLSTPLAEVAHPLMTFGDELYGIDTYRRIPFVWDRGRRPFPELFPRLTNPHTAIDPELRSLYHALCVLGGNFTTLLWDKVFAEAETTLGIDRTLFYPFLEQVAHNLTAHSDPVTGPLARGDARTISRHLEALSRDPFAEVYRAFVAAHQTEPPTRVR